MMLPTPDAMKWASLLQETLQQLAKLEERMRRLEDQANSLSELQRQTLRQIDDVATMLERYGFAGSRKKSRTGGRDNEHIF